MEILKWKKTKTFEKLLERAYFNGKKFFVKGHYISQMNWSEASQMITFNRIIRLTERATKIGKCAVATGAEVNELIGYKILNEDF